ncbi:MAG: hypothetical protein SGI90_02750 [Candidatus Eisenbacteria bacterium]|nr:hypothetical protein [Candidatus Eisenbacteria bacterium]
MNRRIKDILRNPAARRCGLAIALLSGWSSLVPAAAYPADEPPANDLTYTRESYYYAATGLRDPFGSLVSGRFVSEDSKRLPDIGSIDLLGVMWGDSDKFALVEDQEGNGFVLRVGDPVVNGEVAGITRESLSIRQHFFGSSTTVTLKLKPKEEKGHASKKRR